MACNENEIICASAKNGIGIKDIFDAEAIDDNETIRIIRDFFNNFGFILDPHTATAVGASYKVKNDLPTVVLGTAHPYKFADTVKLAINREVSTPEQVVALPDKKEKFEILDNNLQKVKNYILEKYIFEKKYLYCI